MYKLAISSIRAAAALLQNQLKYGLGIASNHPYDRDQKK